MLLDGGRVATSPSHLGRLRRRCHDRRSIRNNIWMTTSLLMLLTLRLPPSCHAFHYQSFSRIAVVPPSSSRPSYYWRRGTNAFLADCSIRYSTTTTNSRIQHHQRHRHHRRRSSHASADVLSGAEGDDAVAAASSAVGGHHHLKKEQQHQKQQLEVSPQPPPHDDDDAEETPVSSSTTATAATIQKAEDVIVKLARKNRSWRRLKDVAYLACCNEEDNDGDDSIQRKNTTAKRSSRRCADIGTDHGLLALALQFSGHFDKVVGVDVSSEALQDGGIRLRDQVNEYRSRHPRHSSSSNNNGQLSAPPPVLDDDTVEFRQGNGFEAVNKGEAETVCIAGMGVNTMCDILMQTSSRRPSNSYNTDNNNNSPPRRDSNDNNNDDTNQQQQRLLLLDELGCRHLVLQPTNSRPRNLIRLYRTILSGASNNNSNMDDWSLTDERIEYVQSRWYLTCSFTRRQRRGNRQSNDGEDHVGGTESKAHTTTITITTRQTVLPPLPCTKLLRKTTTTDDDKKMLATARSYIDHHCAWLERDKKKRIALGGQLMTDEAAWLDVFGGGNR